MGRQKRLRGRLCPGQEDLRGRPHRQGKDRVKAGATSTSGEFRRVQVRTRPGVRLGRWGTGALSSSRERVPGQLTRLEDAGTAALSG